MKRKIVILLVAWMLLFTAAYATKVESLQKIYNRNTLSTNSLTDIILPIIGGGEDIGGGGGDGTGGRGVSTFENLSNVDTTETVLANLIPNITTIYKFSRLSFGIYEISTISTQEEYDVALRLELLKGLSTLIGKPAPGNIYKYQNAWIGSDNVKNAAVRFKVENSWVDSNSISDTNIVMLRWNKDNKDWVKLNTSMINKDDVYTYFESKLEGMSQFAIVGIEKDINVPVSTVAQTTTQTATELEEQKKTPNIGVVMTFVILLVVYIFNRKR